jgi:drug/metabolite transporter (DMT)-like permease
MTQSSAKQKPAILALLGLVTIWGYNWTVMKIGVQYAAPFDFAAMRVFFGAIGLFLMMLALRKPIAPQAILGTMMTGILQTTGVYGLSMWALVNGAAGKTAVLNYTMPFWVLLFAWVFLGERPQKLQWIGVSLAFLGLICILLPLDLSQDLFSKCLAMIAGVGWGLGVIVAKRTQQTHSFDLLSFTAWQMLFASIPLLLLAWLVPAPPVNWTLPFILSLLYNIIPGTVVACLLWFFALNRLPAGTASLGMLGTPVIGVLVAWWQLGERPSGLEAVGILLILGALALNVFQVNAPSVVVKNNK